MDLLIIASRNNVGLTIKLSIMIHSKMSLLLKLSVLPFTSLFIRQKVPSLLKLSSLTPKGPASNPHIEPSPGKFPVWKKVPIFEFAQPLFAAMDVCCHENVSIRLRIIRREEKLTPMASMVRSCEPLYRGDHFLLLTIGVAGSMVLLINKTGLLVFPPNGPGCFY